MMEKDKKAQKQITLKLRGERIALNVLVEHIIRTAIDVAKNDLLNFSSFPGIIAEEYKIDSWASAKLCRPVFWYLTKHKTKRTNGIILRYKIEREALIPHDGRTWVPNEKLWKLTHDEIRNMTNEIINEYEEYYVANAKEFGLLCENEDDR